MRCALGVTDSIEDRLQPMHIGVAPLDAAAIAGRSDTRARRLVAAIKLQLIEKLRLRTEEIGFFAFLEELPMLVSTVRQQHAAAGWDFESPCGVLVGTHLTQQAESDFRAGNRACVVIIVDFAATPSFGQNVVAMEAKPVIARELLENDLPARRPFAVAQELPIAAANPQIELQRRRHRAGAVRGGAPSRPENRPRSSSADRRTARDGESRRNIPAPYRQAVCQAPQNRAVRTTCSKRERRSR